MPDIRNCRKCGKLYTYLGGAPICQDCKQEDEDDFKKVKDYLYKNPGASMSQVSAELEISVEKIKRFLKDGRLEIISEEGNIVLECENCGKPIKTGRFCEECERILASGFRNTANQMKTNMDHSAELQKQSGIGMRYLNKDNKKY